MISTEEHLRNKIRNKTGGALLKLALALIPFAITTSPAQSQGADQIVQLQTTKGPIVIRVFYSMVPTNAGNFLELVDSGFYNGLRFHRVENWLIQGGDPNGDGSGCATDSNTGQTKYLPLELNRNLNHNQAGMVAMARFGNNLNSASCQFYITKSPAGWCNGKYTVFGRVVNGMNTVYAIRPGDRIISASILQQNSGGQPQRSNAPASDFENSEPPTDSYGRPKDSGF